MTKLFLVLMKMVLSIGRFNRIKSDTKSAFLENIGLLYPLGRRLTLGAAVQNMGSQLANDSLPLTLKIGIVLSRKSLTLAADFPKPIRRYFWMSNISTVWISLVTAIGSFTVSGLCVFLGYTLFLIGATGGFKFSSSMPGWALDVFSATPGLGFALFGMIISVYALKRLIGKSK